MLADLGGKDQFVTMMSDDHKLRRITLECVMHFAVMRVDGHAHGDREPKIHP